MRGSKGSAAWPLLAVAIALSGAVATLVEKAKPYLPPAQRVMVEIAERVAGTLPGTTYPGYRPGFDPDLPQVIPDTIRPGAPTHTINPTTAAELQSAFDTASCGARILLDSGVTYSSSPGFTLTPRGCPSTNRVFVTSALANVNDTNRVDTTRNFPVITCSGTACRPLRASTGGQYGYWFEDIEITSDAPGTSGNDHVQIHTGTASDPIHFIFNRVYIHGRNDSVQIRRCFLGNGAEIAIMRSALVFCQDNGADSQAFVAWNTLGPLFIYRNLLIGGGEVFFIGGADPVDAAHVPRDITVAQNYIYAPHDPYFTQPNATVFKNNIETKLGIRQWYWGNFHEGAWPDGQTGFAILFKSTNQSGGFGDFSEAGHITYERNRIDNVNGAFNFAGDVSATRPQVPGHHLKVDNNWVTRLEQNGDYQFGPSGQVGTVGRNFQINSWDTLTISRHRSMNPGVHTVLEFCCVGGSGLVLNNNLWQGPTDWGMLGEPIDDWFPNPQVDSQIVVNGTASRYSGEPGFSFPASEPVGSGADTSAINAATCGVKTGNFGAGCAGAPAPSADVSITKAGPSSAGVSDSIWYVMTTVNRGPDSAKDVVVIDSLPGAVTFLTANRSAVHASGVVTWPSIDMARDDTLFDSVRVELPATDQTVIDTAVATLTTADPDAGDRLATLATNVTSGASPPVGDTIYWSSMDALGDVTAPRIGDGTGADQQGGTFTGNGYSATASGERLVVPHASIGMLTDSGTIVFKVVPNYASNANVLRDIVHFSNWNAPGWKFGKHHSGNGNGLFTHWRDGDGTLHFIETLSDTSYVGWAAGDTVEWRITWDVSASPSIIRIWQDQCEVVGLQNSSLVGGEAAGTADDSMQVGSRAGGGSVFADQEVIELFILDQVVPEPSPSCGPPAASTYGNSVWISQHSYGALVLVVDTVGTTFSIPFPKPDSMPGCSFRVWNKVAAPTPADTFLVQSGCDPPPVHLDSAQVDSLVADWNLPGITRSVLRNTPIGG